MTIPFEEIKARLLANPEASASTMPWLRSLKLSPKS
jgi:hypothetical protein